MPTFVFWNIHGKSLLPRVSRICATRAVDVLMMAECQEPDDAVAESLKLSTGSDWLALDRGNSRLRVYTRIPSPKWKLIHDAQRWLIYRTRDKNGEPTFLVVVHLISPLHVDPEDHELELRRVAVSIEDVEGGEENPRTIVVGDFNQRPFDRTLVRANTMHAVMTRQIADRGTRQVRDTISQRMFYNPMWGLLGDRTPGPPGTYYAGSQRVVNYFWEMPDQVLLRPALADGLKHLEILESDGAESLLTMRGIPDKKNGSDHLPILFQIEW
jgi:hypothetical protein